MELNFKDQTVQTENTPNTSQAPVTSNVLRSSDLFKNSKVVLIEHQGIFYNLRLTQGNKLILTK